MHWAPIPIAEFELPPASELSDGDVFRLLSRAPRRGFWLTAIAVIGLLTIGLIGVATGNTLLGVSFFVISVVPGTGNMLVRHNLNVALWIAREPVAVYWAEPKKRAQHLIWTRRTEYLLTLRTPAPVQLDVLLAQNELIGFLHWLRRRNPDVLVGRFSPNDSDGRLSGKDPWSPQPSDDASADPIHGP